MFALESTASTKSTVQVMQQGAQQMRQVQMEMGDVEAVEETMDNVQVSLRLSHKSDCLLSA